MRPRILYTSIAPFQPWLWPLWQEHIDIEEFDPAKTYDKKHCMVMLDDRYDSELYHNAKAQGYRIIKDNAWDTDPEDTYQIANNELTLRVSEWIWIHDATMWQYKNYHLPRENVDPTKFFLLLMNQKRNNRDMLFDAVTNYLDDSLYSYVEKGIMLPGDEFVPHPNHNGTANDRFYIPEWYSNTSFSLVSETWVREKLFVSEKIFKPLAYWHPLVVFGTPNTLKYIQQLGFETFHHVINESYDREFDVNKRLQKIITVLDQLHTEFKKNKAIFQDSRTKEILQHNHALFFNQEKVKSLFTEQLLNPILEFANTP
jgi:hypothetical protein